MGNCLANKEALQLQENIKLNKLLRTQYELEKAVVKILLLGTGNSGKSTILKQFQILHKSEGLGDLSKHRMTISQNITKGIVQVAQGAQDIDQVTVALQKETRQIVDAIRDLSLNDIWESYELVPDKPSQQLSELCIQCWKDPALEQAMEYEGQLSMLEVPIAYFMNNIERIKNPDYCPTTEDVLQARIRTTGIVSIEFIIDSIKCRMLDVGGQRNERKKWISHFDNVTAIMFLISLSEYDKMLLEDTTKNRMVDAMEVFVDIVNCPSFEETNLILFLNKKDLFAEKIQKVPLSVCFEDYDGENEYEPAVSFISQKFVDMFREVKENQSVDSISSDLYVFQTMATNTQNVRTVFNLCKHIIFKTNLASTGMI